jgi:hypothetical protein
LGISAALALASCASSPFTLTAKDDPWRRDAEISCLRAGAVQESMFIEGRSALGGPDSACGAVHPFEVSALGNGLVGLKPSATVQCAMVPALDAWTDDVVIPAAHAVYGLGVAQMRVLSSYSCRPMNNVPGADLSEHGHANAVDIGGFTLTNGYTVSVASGWNNGSAADRRFLRLVHDGACRSFSTVLGPEANEYHRDHFHLDLMPRHVGHWICE